MAILILYATFFASYSEFVYEYYSYFGFPEPSISLGHSIGIIILYLIERLLSRQSMENFFSRIYLYAFVVLGSFMVKALVITEYYLLTYTIPIFLSDS